MTLALNVVIGAHLGSYIDLELDVYLASEIQDKERENFQRNLSVPVDPLNSRWIYNRKNKGTADLLERLGLKEIGALDILDVTSALNAFDEKGRPQNLFDAFSITRRLKPKMSTLMRPALFSKTKTDKGSIRL